MWFWGNTAYDVRWHNEGLELRLMARGGVLKERFELVDGALVGVTGYHRGERLDVVRRPGGSISHLECATFVYTRMPYDPDVEIPGGHPTRLSSPLRADERSLPRRDPSATVAAVGGGCARVEPSGGNRQWDSSRL